MYQKPDRIIFLILGILALCLPARADVTYEQLQIKAERLFDQDDWIPAGALYNFMIHERPEDPDNYGRAVVSAYAVSDTLASLQYLSLALKAHVPLDSVLTKVRQYAFMKSRASDYERFMLDASEEFPWLERPLQPYLLQYFASRKNAPEMIHYSEELLKGLPDSPEFLSTLAEGYMLEDRYDKAVETWLTIISSHPRNFSALVNLATYYEAIGRGAEALPYFRRAEEVRSTPYIRHQIEKIATALQAPKK